MSDCIEYQGSRNALGYGIIHSGGRKIKAYRAAMAEIVGWDALRGKNVNHLCDNPPCVNPEHLYVGTQAENIRDMYERGRAASVVGEKNPRAKLTEDQVREIRAAADITNKQLAAEYGVSPELIGKIISRQRWGHVS